MMNMFHVQKQKQTIWRRSIFMLSAVLFLLMGAEQAKAQCENAFTTNTQMTALVATNTANIVAFTAQEVNFINNKFQAAGEEMKRRLVDASELDEQIRQFFSDWWLDEMRPALQDQMKQLNTAELDNAKHMGMFLDAQNQTMAEHALWQAEFESHRRHRPSEQVCVMDSMGLALSKAKSTSKAMASALALARLTRNGSAFNRDGTVGQDGKAAVQKRQYELYTELFCNDLANDATVPGCNATNPFFIDRDVSPGHVLWGDKTTIDLRDIDEQKALSVMMTQLFDFRYLDPVSQTAIKTSAGQENWLQRRAHEARAGAIFNVFNQLIAERTLSNEAVLPSRQIRQHAKIPASYIGSTAENFPSYKELLDAMTRERFYHQDYLIRTIDTPENSLREQENIIAGQHQILFDTFDRQVDFAFSLIAGYAAELDMQAGVSTDGLTPN
jgi:hypothetical protein